MWRIAVAPVVAVVVAWVPAAPAQADAPGTRSVTLVTGVGNSLGWFGGSAERYLGDRFSLFAGMGYTPPIDGVPSGVTPAGGARLFTSGVKHRGFLELSVSQIAVESGIDRRLYGPGLQAGWQFVSRGGFTVMASLGAGYILAGDVSQPLQPLMGAGIGYTWRHPAP